MIATSIAGKKSVYPPNMYIKGKLGIINYGRRTIQQQKKHLEQNARLFVCITAETSGQTSLNPSLLPTSMPTSSPPAQWWCLWPSNRLWVCCLNCWSHWRPKVLPGIPLVRNLWCTTTIWNIVDGIFGPFPGGHPTHRRNHSVKSTLVCWQASSSMK